MGCIVYGEGGAVHTPPPGGLGAVCVSLFVCLSVCLALSGDGDGDGDRDSTEPARDVLSLHFDDFNVPRARKQSASRAQFWR